MQIHLVLAVILTLAFLALFLGKSTFTRWVMAASILLAILTLPSELYVDSYLDSVGCTGNWLEGFNCPTWTVFTKAVIVHQISGLFFSAYLLFVFPFLWLISAIIEYLMHLRACRSKSK